MTKTYTDILSDGGSDVLGQVIAQRERLTIRMADVKRVIAILSGKGGVGKSTLTANLAAAIANRGMQVGVLDADLNGPTLAMMLGVKDQSLQLAPEGITPAVGMAGVKVMSIDIFLRDAHAPVTWQHPEGLAQDSFVWRNIIETTAVREFLSDTLWGELDVLLIDLPPGAERFSTLAKLLPSLSGIMVTIPSEVSYRVVNKSIRAVEEDGGRLLGLIENMTSYLCPNCSHVGPLFSRKSNEETSSPALELPMLGEIPFDPQMAEACDCGVPYVLSHPNSLIAGVFDLVAKEITETSLRSEQ